MHRVSRWLMVVVGMSCSFGCAGGQIRRLEEQVRILETRLEILDENSKRSHTESTQSLQELYNTLKSQNDVIQKNQLRLTSSLDDISTEILKMRREIDESDVKVDRLETRIGSAESLLKTEMASVQENLKTDLESGKKNIAKSVSDLKAECLRRDNEMEQRFNKTVSSLESRLKSNISSLKNDVGQSYNRIEQMIRGLAPENGAVTSTSKGTEGFIHVVDSGETLSKIASDYGVSLDEVISVNDIKDAAKIQIGQEIIIPSSE